MVKNIHFASVRWERNSHLFMRAACFLQQLRAIHHIRCSSRGEIRSCMENGRARHTRKMRGNHWRRQMWAWRLIGVAHTLGTWRRRRRKQVDPVEFSSTSAPSWGAFWSQLKTCRPITLSLQWSYWYIFILISLGSCEYIKYPAQCLPQLASLFHSLKTMGTIAKYWTGF